MTDDWLQLAFAGMHPDRLRSLVADAGGPSEVLAAIELGRIQVPPAARIAAAVPATQRAHELASWGIEFVTPADDTFPGSLRALPDAPLFLFRRGRPVESPHVAIVGTRACTAYGRRLALGYGRAVSEAGWSVVSGLARGIDGAAHRGAIEGPTPPVAVLGSGIDVWYPRDHTWLGEAILGLGGSVLSESPPGTRPVGWRFPPRNRIISGLSSAVVVVEAGDRGGALITARTAAEQGVDVFATPGDVDRPSSVGTNQLIRDGAHPVHDPRDLIEALELVVGPALAVPEDIQGPDCAPGSDIRTHLAAAGRRDVRGATEAVPDNARHANDRADGARS